MQCNHSLNYSVVDDKDSTREGKGSAGHNYMGLSPWEIKLPTAGLNRLDVDAGSDASVKLAMMVVWVSGRVFTRTSCKGLCFFHYFLLYATIFENALTPANFWSPFWGKTNSVARKLHIRRKMNTLLVTCVAFWHSVVPLLCQKQACDEKCVLICT